MQSAPGGYRLRKQIYSSAYAAVCEAVSEASGAEVIVKWYHSDGALDASPRARHEFDMLQRAAGPGIPRALELHRSTERPLLVLERLPGLSLAHLLQGRALELDTWLHVASQLAETLARIHAAHVLHKDLTPGNVLFDSASGRVSICDFGLSGALGAAERPEGHRTGALECSLQYIAPEQTGRMNRGCDFRSDLYSLGATLYHALTGQPPFASQDALELIHAHLARMPRSPTELRPGVPETLSRIVLKLLRKEPAERYQSARGLHADLCACHEQILRSGSIPADFELGSAEVPDRPRFSAKLYGREREAALLREVYEDAAGGRTRTFWIQGEPGTGKSALVDGLRPVLTQTGGYLALGKFDLYRDRPYAGWIAALGSLVQQLLVESDARLQRWRDALLVGLGKIAPALLDLAPDLVFVLGELPPLPALGPAETQARLSLALQRFIATCARPAHPLVLVLDDLQWSDAGSRTLLEELLASAPAALLLIGAYRASDVGTNHPLHWLLERLGERTAPASIELAPLSSDAVAAMLADALERPPEQTTALAALVARRTGNSPLLVQQFIEHLHGRGLLHYEHGVGWSWDDAAVGAADLPDSAVGLVTGKLERLEPEGRAVLQFASCIGDEFDAELLCELDRRSQVEIETVLYTLADAGLITPCPRGFRFVHDRIREAAQQQLSPEDRARIHCDTAQLLLERTPESERPQRVFEIVEHLNRGILHALDELRRPAIELNLLAGNRALAAGAAAAARGHLEMARSLVRGREADVPTALALEIALQGAESAYQLGDFEAALALLDEVAQAGLEPMESLRVEAKRVQVFAVCRKPELCVHHALLVLRRLGVRWPLHPSRLRAQWELWRIARLLRRRPSELMSPARAIIASQTAPLLLIRPSAAALSRVDVYLAVLATCLSFRLQLQHGYYSAPGFTIAVYATYQYLFLGNAARAQRLARTALEWAARSPGGDPRCQHMVHAVLNPFLMQRRQAIGSLDRIHEAAREIGDREFAYYARFTQTLYLAISGDPVAETAKRMERLVDEVQGAVLWQPEASRCRSVCALLALEPPSSAVLEQLLRDDDAARAGSAGSTFYGDLLWLMLLTVFGRPDLAFARSQQAWDGLFRVSPFVQVYDHTFYRGLAAAQLAEGTRGQAARGYHKTLRLCSRIIESRVRDGPDFVHMACLLQAERARLAGNAARARRLYEQAGQRASQQNFPHHAALAHERRASLLGGLRRQTEAAAAVRLATDIYRAWGAVGKADLLAREHQDSRASRR